MRWDDEWEGAVAIPYFQGFGQDIPKVAQDPSEPPSPFGDDDEDDDVEDDAEDPSDWDVLFRKGKFEIQVATRGEARVRPTDEQRRAWRTVLDRGDAVWDELMDAVVEEYRRQRPVRVRWWRAVFGDHALDRMLPDVKDAKSMRRLVRPVGVLVQPVKEKSAQTPDVLVQFIASWHDPAFSVFLRDGRVADIANYTLRERDEDPIFLDHPAIGRLVWSDVSRTWLGDTPYEPFRDYCNVADWRTNFRRNRARFKNPELPLEWPFVQGRFVVEVFPKDVEPPTVNQAKALEAFRAGGGRNAKAVLEALLPHYNAYLADRRANPPPTLSGSSNPFLELMKIMQTGGESAAADATSGFMKDSVERLRTGNVSPPPVADVHPEFKSIDELNDALKLEAINVFPDDGRGGSPPLGFKFYGVADGVFGVRWRDGKVEAAGEDTVAEPKPPPAGGKKKRPTVPELVTEVVESAVVAIARTKAVDAAAGDAPGGTAADSVTLAFRERSSDKVYRAEVVTKGKGHVVNFAFGRRGAKLSTGTKTPKPVPLAKAREIFRKLVDEKTAKGYRPEGQAAAAAEPAKAPAAKAKASPAPSAAPGAGTYDLKVVEDDGYDVEADLKSPVLDRAMHAKGKVRLRLSRERPEPGTRKKGFALDPYPAASVEWYLQSQAGVRQTLETQLSKHQEEFDPEGDPIRDEVWEWVEVLCVDLDAKPARHKGRPSRSSLRVVLDCDWEQEHTVVAEFRDGTFVKLYTE